jgi:hypothetical protein
MGELRGRVRLEGEEEGAIKESPVVPLEGGPIVAENIPRAGDARLKQVSLVRSIQGNV